MTYEAPRGINYQTDSERREDIRLVLKAHQQGKTHLTTAHLQQLKKEYHTLLTKDGQISAAGSNL